MVKLNKKYNETTIVNTPKRSNGGVILGKYFIKETTPEFTMAGLMAQNGKRTYLLNQILEIGGSKKGKKLNLEKLFKKSDIARINNEKDIDFRLVQKYNDLLSAPGNNIPIRIQAEPKDVNGKKMKMTDEITVIEV